MSGYKKINCLYEFKTPNGFLPIGFEYKSIPIIFNHINTNSNLHKNSIIRTTDTNKFELVDNIIPFYNIINFKKTEFNYKLISDITDAEISNDLNILFIVSTRAETILNYIERVDFTDILSEKTINLVKYNKNFKIVIADEKEGGFYHSDLFFNNLYSLHNHIGLDNSEQIIYITSSASIETEYQNFLKNTKLTNFMKVSTIDFYILTDPGYNIKEYYKNISSHQIPYLDKNVEYSIDRKSVV
jgi:hypothetical protein